MSSNKCIKINLVKYLCSEYLPEISPNFTVQKPFKLSLQFYYPCCLVSYKYCNFWFYVSSLFGPKIRSELLKDDNDTIFNHL